MDSLNPDKTNVKSQGIKICWLNNKGMGLVLLVVEIKRQKTVSIP